MTLSELKNIVDELIDEGHGDLPVIFDYDGMDMDVDSVEQRDVHKNPDTGKEMNDPCIYIS